MRNTFRILFYLKKNAPLRDGRLPIMARITICGQRVQLSTHLAVARELWNASGGQAAGRSRTARELNRHMDDIRYRLEACYRKHFLDGSFVTPAMVKELSSALHSVRGVCSISSGATTRSSAAWWE